MPLVDTLLRAAEAGLYRVHFSQEIINDATRNLIEDKRMTNEGVIRFQRAILENFAEAFVQVPNNLAALMTNHPKDRHVVAAAVAAHAEVIVTFNLKHFPRKALQPWNLDAQHPDDFLADLCNFHAIRALAKIIKEQANALKKPPISILELLEKLYRDTPVFSSQVVTYFWGEDIAAITRKFIKVMSRSTDVTNYTLLDNHYNIVLTNERLIIFAKDGRGEILISDNEKLTGMLIPEDIRLF